MNIPNLVILAAESSAHSVTSLPKQYVLKSPVMLIKVPGMPLIGAMPVILGVLESATL